MIKDRDQTVSQFLDSLQQEYFISEIRSKIYPKEKDKRYYKKLMKYKREKIEKIQSMHSLLTIFNSEELRNEYIHCIYPDVGLPKFDMNEQDIRNYFSNGSLVKINENGTIKTGIIMSSDLKNNIIAVKLRGDSKSRPFICSQITRNF